MSNSHHTTATTAAAVTTVITAKTVPSAGAASPGAAPPLLLDVRATARALGIPQKTVGTWNRTGRLPMPIRMGRRSLFWKADELADWVRRDCPPRQRWENMKGTRR